MCLNGIAICLYSPLINIGSLSDDKTLWSSSEILYIHIFVPVLCTYLPNEKNVHLDKCYMNQFAVLADIYMYLLNNQCQIN